MQLMRLSFEMTSTTFTVHDNISGGVIIYENDHFKSFSLDKGEIIKRLQAIQSAVASWTQKKSWRQPSDVLSNSKRLIIREDGQDSWTLSYDNNSAKLVNGQLRYKRGFDINILFSYINKMYHLLVSADAILQPKVDIVRRIPDARLVVWTYKGHSTVCYEDGIKGITMTNCLVDGTYYPLVLVQADEETNTCTIFTTDFEEIVSYPLDASIKFFYKDEVSL